MEHIVFTQEELDKAIGMGYRNVALCDNTFTVPENIEYIKIGDVKVIRAAGEGKSGQKDTENPPHSRALRESSGHMKSFGKSFSSSYRARYGLSFSSNFSSSYRARYGLSFQSSFGSGYAASYRSSFGAGFLSSFGTSFRSRYGTSFNSSVLSSWRKGGSFSGGSRAGRVFKLKRRIKEISINGYGIELI